jgi:hypothetical protein
MIRNVKLTGKKIRLVINNFDVSKQGPGGQVGRGCGLREKTALFLQVKRFFYSP